jgi:hypothetical protein
MHKETFAVDRREQIKAELRDNESRLAKLKAGMFGNGRLPNHEFQKFHRAIEAIKEKNRDLQAELARIKANSRDQERLSFPNAFVDRAREMLPHDVFEKYA